jgi:hypothetical protein
MFVMMLNSSSIELNRFPVAGGWAATDGLQKPGSATGEPLGSPSVPPLELGAAWTTKKPQRLCGSLPLNFRGLQSRFPVDAGM